VNGHHKNINGYRIVKQYTRVASESHSARAVPLESPRFEGFPRAKAEPNGSHFTKTKTDASFSTNQMRVNQN
jgi:hypothetical protein